MVELQKKIERLQKREDERKLDAYTQYDEILQFNLMGEMDAWYYAEDERACKAFIQGYLQEMNISIGDFSKAILKVVAIIKEMILVCEKSNELYCLSKLVNIENNILKYVATTRSLYV